MELRYFNSMQVDAQAEVTTFTRQEMMQTRSSFLTDNLVVDKHGRGLWVYSTMALVIATFILGVVIYATWSASFRSYLSIPAAIIGLLFVLLGWLSSSTLKVIKSAPSTTIDKADGLSEVQGSWASEKALMVSPVGKESCILYKVQLQYWQNSRNGGYWVTLAEYAKGTPALLSDGSGYLAVDLPNAEINLEKYGTRFYAVNSEGELALSKTPQGEDLIRYVKTAPEELDPTLVGVELSNNYKPELHIFGGRELSVLETSVPAEDPGFALGRVISTDKVLNGKPVKAMVYDKRTRLLIFESGNEAKFEKSFQSGDKFRIAVGCLLLVCAAVLAVV